MEPEFRSKGNPKHDSAFNGHALGRYRKINMVMGEVTGVDTERKRVFLSSGPPVHYDQLVIATGSDYNYFGNDAWRANAPGMKTIHEARSIRQRLLLSFEKAERAQTAAEKRNLLTYIVIGGGPAGVEMAGAISELGRFMIDRDFRNIVPDHMRVILVEAGPKILAAFPDKLSTYAVAYLEKIGVEVRTGERVLDVTPDGVTVGEEFIYAGCVVWNAGVKASPANEWLGIIAAPGGRIPVDGHLAVKGLTDVYALGDTAHAVGSDGKPLPGLAQVAKQQGVYLGKFLRDQTAEATACEFRNRGNTAVIGRNAAVLDFGKWTLKGRPVWFLWALVHV